MTRIWVDQWGNVLGGDGSIDGSMRDRYSWTEDEHLVFEAAGTGVAKRVGARSIPWPALSALGAIRCAVKFRIVRGIDWQPHAVSIGFGDGTEIGAHFADLLPPNLVAILPEECNPDRIGESGEDVAWAIYDEALWKASDILLAGQSRRTRASLRP